MKAKFAALASLALAAVTSVHAALPASVNTVVTNLQADGQAVFDAVFPVVGVMLGLVVVIKLFKRFIKKI